MMALQLARRGFLEEEPAKVRAPERPVQRRPDGVSTTRSATRSPGFNDATGEWPNDARPAADARTGKASVGCPRPMTTKPGASTAGLRQSARGARCRCLHESRRRRQGVKRTVGPSAAHRQARQPPAGVWSATGTGTGTGTAVRASTTLSTTLAARSVSSTTRQRRRRTPSVANDGAGPRHAELTDGSTTRR